MDEFGCDYLCRTVGESIIKYNIPDDWFVAFDAYDDIYPIICMQASLVRRIPAVMALKLRVVEHQDEEYAGCMLLTNRKTIHFKIDYFRDLINAMNTE